MPRTVIFLVRWLLFRLMLLSGLVKLASGDPAWWNLTALTFHYETQPLPTWVSWYVHNLPESFHRVSCFLMFVVELALPFLLLRAAPAAPACRRRRGHVDARHHGDRQLHLLQSVDLGALRRAARRRLPRQSAAAPLRTCGGPPPGGPRGADRRSRRRRPAVVAFLVVVEPRRTLGDGSRVTGRCRPRSAVWCWRRIRFISPTRTASSP